MGIENILFLIIFTASSLLFARNLKRILRIKLGKDVDEV